MLTHPLGDLLPPLNELELSKLVAELRATGQSEPVVTLDGKILDGRDLFYACGVAGIKPVTLEYAGDDPVAFVAARIRAQHPTLNQSQRALIAAQMSPVRKFHGYAKRALTDVRMERAAELMAVSTAMASLARRCLAGCAPEQIAAVRNGEASVNSLGHALRRRDVESEAASTPDKSDIQAARTETLRVQSAMWTHLRDGLTHLAELPLPSEVVLVARRQDRGLIDRRLEKSIKWLEEFRDVWRRRDEDAA